MSSSNDSYPEPEGWGNDGFWADSGIDADYETGLTGAVRPDPGPHEVPGFSYWSDGKGWESSPGPDAGEATALDGMRAAAPIPTAAPAPGGTPGDPTRMDSRGLPGAAPWDVPVPADPTAFYGAPGGPGRAPGGSGGRGPGGPAGPSGPSGPGRNDQRQGRRWWHPTWKKALALTSGALVVFLLALAGVYLYLSNSAKIPAAITDANYQNTTVYYSDGKTPIGTIGVVDRQDLTFGQIPTNLQNAVLAAEDRSFWTEGGISPTGILRAAYNDLMSSGGSLSGGSTITQEFVRNYYDGIGTQQTASRKVKEVFIAQKLVKTKSKQWILEHYLNLIYLGDNSYGVAAAAQTYFNKPVAQLSVAQDAVIAAIIQQPSNYPRNDPTDRAALIARWHYVLHGMASMHALPAAQAATLKFPALKTDSATSTGSGAAYKTSSTDPWAPYVMDVVYRELSQVDKVPTSELETGGLKVVTTISRPMEAEMYSAVNQNFALIRSQGYTIPSYVLTGAEMQNPSNGAILAMYPGRGQNMSVAKCKIYDCDNNTAVYTREQVGSSFKPYVASAAVQEGMNVQSSILNASPYLWVPPDSPTYNQLALSVTSASKAGSGYFPVSNDGGEIIGNSKQGGGTTVQNALAQSSNTAFTDLAHRATTAAIIRMAQSYGVDIEPFSQGGSNLTNLLGQVGLALGTASLTVNEQTTMLSTIDDNGLYHAAHLIKYWKEPAGSEKKPSVDSHQVLTPAQDSQVQYAMEMTTVDGTGTAAAYGLGNRQIIAKTGTTTNSHSGFFLGAIPQYSLVVGMFTESQNPNSPQSLVPLGGGGFGGARPAGIWNTIAQAEFANLPAEYFQNPTFTGDKWNQVGKLPKAKKKKKAKPVKCTSLAHGKPQPKGCVIPSPSPTPTPSQSTSPSPTASPTPSPTATATATATASPSPTASTSASVTPTAAPSSTATAGAGGVVGGGRARAATGVQASLALGGVLAILPGSLLWTTMAARRRRRRRVGASG